MDEEGLIEWDWIGEDSPMMSKSSEAEFVLDRLCESMRRYLKHVAIPSSPEGNIDVQRRTVQAQTPDDNDKRS